jgi:hypothetical protein
VPNVKPVKLTEPRSGVDGDLPNVPFHALGNSRQKSVELRRRSLGNQFDPAIRQISHEAGHFKALGQPPGRFTEADPLDMTAVKSLMSFDRRWSFDRR